MEVSDSLRGSHGTTVSRAANIQNSGFEKSEGRLGEGVYFWCESPYSDYLAEAWWNFSYNKGTYSKDDNSGCARIIAKFVIDEEYYLNLDDKKIKNKLAELCVKKKLGYGARNKEMAALIMLFVTRLEKELGHEFKIMESTVAAPREFVQEYPIGVLGAPSCYVVFDLACIEILSVGYC